ncbi:hypothetical protein GCM10009630_62930 [Kribbella jejuensis]|uniref:Ribonuclease E n=1 Tax=Kribbella jejuensis TaxID=236068 RepID=A0A542EAS4_9ACTN|nr:Rne/Rng family ribonuclease [Kribbella jejuensis]TQJ12415.1 ribonuclease E [Kribbella jejuensis]
MLDNEPTNEAAGTAAPARKTAKKTAAAKKTTAKKAATTRKRTVQQADVTPTQSDDLAADPVPAKKAAAKKTAAKKTTVKKAAAKAPAKKTAKRATKQADIFPQASDEPTSVADAGPVVESAPPVKKTTRKRATKKTANTGLTASDTPVTDGPVADAVSTPADAPRAAAGAVADVDAPASTAGANAGASTAGTDAAGADAGAPARKRTSRRRTAKTAEADNTTPADASAATGTAGADQPGGSASAGAGRTGGSASADGSSASDGAGTAGDPVAEASGTRRSRRRPAPAAVLFQAPDVPSAQAPAAEAEVQTASPSVPEPGADEQPSGTRRRRNRRTRDAEPTEDARPTANATDETDTTADAEPTSGTRSRRSRSNRTADRQAAHTDATAPVEADSAADDRAGSDGRIAADADGTSSTRSRRSRSNRTADRQVAQTDTTAAALGEADSATDAHAGLDVSELVDEDSELDGEGVEAHGDDGEEGGEGTRRRRRRRGGRRRRKSGDVDGADDSADEQSDDEQDEDADAHADDADTDGAADSDDDEAAGGSSRRRRRRRRRKGEESSGSADDPDEIVVRVREPRSKNTANEITAVEGSTRLEAKKQRRREGRAAGRRRAPIVTEAEFLARRESVERTMVIRSREDVTQIAVSEDNVLVEHYVTTAEQTSLIGNVYLGRVQNVLPSMEAAFIDIGKGRNAVLYAGEVDWATLGGANGPRKIEQVLKSGQSVLVQVTKDPIGHKGARLTNQISLPGRYVVYVPRGGNGGISRKLPDTERNRLKTILKDIVPDEAGVIVRTAAEGASEEELTSDVSRLQAAWEEIDKKSKNGQAPQLLYGEPDLLIRVVRDLFTEDFAKLVISGDRAYDQVREYVEGVAPHLADRVEKWTGDGDVFANFRIDEQIKKALDRKVWLPSGGSLIIDRTEAMTVVDVNTGKFTGSGGNLEETVTKNNLEAAEEIVRQLRLRDIGGIIVIDFIDMVLESNRDLVLRRLVECLGRDRTKHQVAEVTSLGLVQMTRKRIGTGLLEAFSENCDHCGGRGLILHDEPKESRRNGRNGQQSGNGQQNGQQNEHDHAKPAAQAEDSGRKSSRRRRGRGRGDDEQAHEPEAPHHNGDAAQKLAQIAAATVKKDEETGTPEPTGYPISAETEDHVSPEATGFPAPPAEVAAEAVVEVDAAEDGQNDAPKTRRRRSARSRNKTATEGDATAPADLVTTGS